MSAAATSFEEARARLARITPSDEGYSESVMRVYVSEPWRQLFEDLRVLLAGPPEPSEEEVANRLLAVAFHACQPGRGDIFGWLEDNITPFAANVQALYRSKAK